MSAKVIFVDDEPDILRGFSRVLRGKVNFLLASSGKEALKLLSENDPVAVVVSDMYMPEMTGVDLLTEVGRRAPETVRVMLTGHADLNLAVRAMHEGRVFRFLSKPCSPEELLATIGVAIRQHELQIAERDLLENTLNGTIRVLMDILFTVAPASFGRAQRLRTEMGVLARALGLDRPYTYELAAMVAPIGLVVVPPTVIAAQRSGQPLSEAEKSMLARIPETGSNMLRQIPRMEEVADIVLYQYKHFDGTGFPADAKVGARIPIGSRMLRVLSDRQTLLTSDKSKGRVFDILRGRPGWYDPAVVDVAERCYPEVEDKAEVASIQVGVIGLALGDILSADVHARDGHLLLAAGNVVTETVRERLRNYESLGIVDEPLVVQRPAKDVHRG